MKEEIEKVMIGGNHLASYLLGHNCDPVRYDSYEQVQSLCNQDCADVWVAWRAIMDLRNYYEGVKRYE